jgi:hypothetical protein
LTDEEKLEVMKAILEENEDCRTLTDQQLALFLDQSGGDVNGAIYRGAMQKARMDGITLPDGTTLAHSREYWLAVASCHRPNFGGCMPRADGR